MSEATPNGVKEVSCERDAPSVRARTSKLDLSEAATVPGGVNGDAGHLTFRVRVHTYKELKAPSREDGGFRLILFEISDALAQTRRARALVFMI